MIVPLWQRYATQRLTMSVDFFTHTNPVRTGKKIFFESFHTAVYPEGTSIEKRFCLDLEGFLSKRLAKKFQSVMYYKNFLSPAPLKTG